MKPSAQMQRLMWQNGRAALCKGHFSKHFVAGKNGHVAKAVTQPHPKCRHDLVHPLGGGTVAIAIGLVAAQIGNKVEIANPDGRIGEEVADKFAVAKLGAGENALMQPVMVIVAKLEGLEGLPIAALSVVELGADADAQVRIFEEAPKIGQAHRLRKYADRDGHFHAFSAILCSKFLPGAAKKQEE